MMNFNSERQPRLLYSDSLEGNLPDEIFDEIFESGISVVIVTENKEDFIIGTLVGVEFSENLKIDIKISIEHVFNFVTSILSDVTKRKVKNVILSLGEEIANFSGPYNIKSAKIIEIDVPNKSCVLAVDLFKVEE